jgi:hypothetical protein
MKVTNRELAAARSLAEAFLEFLSAHEEGRQARRPARPSPPEPTRAMPPETERLLLTAREATALLSISQGTLINHRAPKGPIPVVYIGNIPRYAVADLRKAIEGMRITRRDSQDADRAEET